MRLPRTKITRSSPANRRRRLPITQTHPIAIYTNMTGKGLEVDAKLLQRVLLENKINSSIINGFNPINAKWNIFLEVLPKARVSNCIWIPNLEWVTDEMMEYAKRYVDVVVAKTLIAKEKLSIHFGEKVFYLPWITSLDVPLLDDVMKKDFGSRPVVFLHVGGDEHSVWWKNSNLVMDTFIKAKLNNSVLWVVRRDRSNRDIYPGIKIYGEKRLPPDEMVYLREGCDFIVAPSIAEGFGHCVFEGMIYGKPVITTDAKPMSELIDEKRGRLVKSRPGNFRGLVQENQVDGESLIEVYKELSELDPSEYFDMCKNSYNFAKDRIDNFRELVSTKLLGYLN